MGWRWDHFRGWGELECEVQLCTSTWKRLHPKTCMAALLPRVMVRFNDAPALLTAASIDFSPLIPWSALIALLAIGYAVLIFGAVEKLSGWLWRGVGLAGRGDTADASKFGSSSALRSAVENTRGYQQ